MVRDVKLRPMTRSLTRSASLAVFAAAICAAGSGVAGAAAPNAVTPFEVCSPLGCTVQRVTGTVETSTGFTRVRGSATDRSENAQLTVRLQVVNLNGSHE